VVFNLKQNPFLMHTKHTSNTAFAWAWSGFGLRLVWAWSGLGLRLNARMPKEVHRQCQWIQQSRSALRKEKICMFSEM
jgi:hypothetical protein